MKLNLFHGAACSALAAAVCLLALQSALLLRTVPLVYVYEFAMAAELYASLCLAYCSVRLALRAHRRRFKPLFACAFSPSVAYAAAVMCGAPLDALGAGTSFAVAASWLCAAISLALAFPRLTERRPGRAPEMAKQKNTELPSAPGQIAAHKEFPARATASTPGTFPMESAPELRAAQPAPPEKTNAPAAPVFSAREQEVMAHLLDGKTVQQTADALFISAATVKTHVQHIYEKAGVHNRAELARFAAAHNPPNG